MLHGLGILEVLAFFIVLLLPVLAADKPVVVLITNSLAAEFFNAMAEGVPKFAAEDGTFELIRLEPNQQWEKCA
jgi:ABC-type sugar transport system substrate-binding protein